MNPLIMKMNNIGKAINNYLEKRPKKHVMIGGYLWEVKLAENEAKGLSKIKKLELNSGMLFDLGYDTNIKVTTEKMKFYIDIIIIGGGLSVKGIARNIAPGKIISFSSLARYFLEVNAGEADNIKTGMNVRIV